MKSKVFLLVFLLLFASVLCGFDWRSLTDSDLRRWSDAIDVELDRISKDAPPSKRNGYYWYLYGTMKISAYCVRERIIFQAQSQLERAITACNGIFGEDEEKANACIVNIKRLRDGPPFK